MQDRDTIQRIPVSTVERLCRLYALCDRPAGDVSDTFVPSRTIGEWLGVSPDLVRRDISYLGEVGCTGMGYDVRRLREHIAQGLGLCQERRTCVVGLGRLGAALLEQERFAESGYRLVAGFDTSINRLETIRTQVPLYPAYEMADTVRVQAIELAMLAVPAAAAQETADALAGAGVVCILNFAPVVVQAHRPGVVVRNVDILNELHVVSSLERLAARARAGAGVAQDGVRETAPQT